MKNLPEKIYLNLGDLTEEEFNDIDFYDLSEVTWSKDDVQGRNVEYVRTDAFIRKACEWIKYNNNNGGCQFDGWEEDFKKYIRGE